MAEVLTTSSPNEVIADQGLLYFRRNDGTELFAADSGGLELVKKIRRGHEPLEEYGQFGSSAYYMDHPFEPLFQAGGAHEMPVDQVISLGYAASPPLVPTCGRHVGDGKDHLAHKGNPAGRNARERGCWQGARTVKFPQLEGVVIEGPFECEHCEREDLPTRAALEQHQRVMHGDQRQRHDLADGIVNGLLRAGLGGGQSPEALAATMLAALRLVEQQRAVPDPDPEPEPEDDDDDESEPEPETESTRERVRQLRAEGLSQIAVAERLGLSRATVQRIDHSTHS